MNILNFARKKTQGEKITMITCYDYSSARLVADLPVDCLLVGDSAAMTMHGHKDTVPATLEMMEFHTRAVSRGAADKFIIGDLPFLSYRKSFDSVMDSVQRLIQAGAHAVKLEGADGNLKLIQHLVESGIPVMGHIGLTIQMIHQLGGFKVQGKTEEGAERLKQQAKNLQEAGCFAVVLECMPKLVAKEITQALTIPTIGIGAGADTDGQVLVWHDLLGLNLDFKPKFVETFVNGQELVKDGVNRFIQAVASGEFPRDEHCY
ncbi:MAG TPA: 3-methyl-2-oxobutanoate hydroxymethyltransferase [Coxiellaceae bacterium]|nr:3-methyl-2-oxobutanoate hydroxymethyltransferase [Coxiellaceae bacterium]